MANPLRGTFSALIIESSKSSTEHLIVDSFRSACLHVECMTAKKQTNEQKKTLAKITFQ